MLHTETVETRTLDLIRTLMSDTKFQDFFLVGGTALSLELGHRMSIDIDMITDKEFDAVPIGNQLSYQLLRSGENKSPFKPESKDGLLAFIHRLLCFVLIISLGAPLGVKRIILGIITVTR